MGTYSFLASSSLLYRIQTPATKSTTAIKHAACVPQTHRLLDRLNPETGRARPRSGNILVSKRSVTKIGEALGCAGGAAVRPRTSPGSARCSDPVRARCSDVDSDVEY